MTEDINIDSCNMPLHQVVVSPITGLLEKIPQEDNKVNTLSFTSFATILHGFILGFFTLLFVQ